jgi:hypothetical protein
MTQHSSWQEFPEEVRHSTAQSHLAYRRLPDAFAIHGPVPASLRDAISAVVDEGAISVLRLGADSELVPAERTTPVYSLGPGGTPAVPTGRLLVRFASGDRAVAHQVAVERAGYRITQTLPHAPEAAWVESADGNLAHALAGVSRLESLPGVVNVEPQMIAPSVRR